MNLADMLSFADIQDLSRIANTYACECNGHSKNELIQSILTKVGRKDVFEQQVGELSLEDIRFLNSLLFDPRGTFSLEELTARAQQSVFHRDGAEPALSPRETIVRFKHRGWLFNGHSLQTRYLFAIPVDLRRRFIGSLTKQFQRQLQTADEPQVYRDEQRLIAEDIWHFLSFLRNQDVMLTSENVMYKRSLQQILDSLSVREEPVGRTAWRFGYGRMFRDYPNRFSLIYDYCYYNDLITEHHQVLALTELGRDRVDNRQKEDLLEVYRFWLRLYKGPIPNLQSLVQWINLLAKTWVTASSLEEVLCALIKPYYYDSPASIAEQRIFQMMMHLGLLRIGEDDEVGRVVQVTKLGSRIIEGAYVEEDDRIVIEG